MAREEQETDWSPEFFARIIDRLGSFRVVIRRNPSARHCRGVFAKIRGHRNKVQAIVTAIRVRRLELRHELRLNWRDIERRTGKLHHERDGFILSAKDGKERDFICKFILEDQWDSRRELEDKSEMIEEVLTFSNQVLQDLKLAFEEASRGLASIELETKLIDRS